MAYVRTLKNLRDEVLGFLDQAGETNTSKIVIDDVIRGLHSSRLTERKWNFMLWSQPQTLTTMVGQRLYSLHAEFFRPLYFWNVNQKAWVTQHTDQSLELSPFSQPLDMDSAWGTSIDWTQQTGSALRFKFAGISQVAAQPTSASTLSVSGQSGKTVTVRGETVDGIAEETITVSTPSTNQFSKILSVAKGDGWTNTMTLTSNGGAVTNLKLLASEYGREYRQLELLSTPTTAETIQYQFYRKPAPLTSDNSIPDIPSEFSRVLVYDALLQSSAYNRTFDVGIVKYWMSEQKRLENGLLEYDEGQDAIGAEAVYTQWIARD